MSDRRRIIAALRAKAASTSFPAEAESLRSKAADLEAKLRAGEQSHPRSEPYAQSDSEWFNGPVDWGKVTHQGQPWNPRTNISGARINFTVVDEVDHLRPDWREAALHILKDGDLFEAMGGIRVDHPAGTSHPPSQG